jgi:aerobic carbon-monoxide dehydrogenase medium subunit
MRYEAPETMKSAVSMLAKEKGLAFVLAGGTDLLVKMKGGYLEPDLVVDIKKIKGVYEIKKSATGFRIGAAVPGVALSENAALKKAWPGVVEGANLIGSKQIQGRCTLAGNLCTGSPAADGVPALFTAKAKVVISGPKGKRTIPVEQVALSPGRNALKKGEIIEAFLLPKRPPRSGDAYLRFIPRTEMDIAVVSAAVSLVLDTKGVITDAQVALGAVSPVIINVPAAVKALVGSKLDDAALENLAAACSAACRPIDDKRGTIEFRTKVAGVLARRAATIAYTRAGGKA